MGEGRGWTEARLAETGALSQLVSEPGDPVGKPVPDRKARLGGRKEKAAKERGGRCWGGKRRVSFYGMAGGERSRRGCPGEKLYIAWGQSRRPSWGRPGGYGSQGGRDEKGSWRGCECSWFREGVWHWERQREL